jgi:transposase
VRECSDGLVETELKIKRGLRRSPVIHADETGMRVNKRLQYVHVACNARLTHYAAASHRGRTAIDEINVLPRYRGTCVHDGLLSYTHYTRCRHALCGVHLLRELTYFEEVAAETKTWDGSLKELLLEMKGEVERVAARGEKRLPAERLAELVVSYDRLVTDGLRAGPPPEVPRQVRKQARNLLLRLERRKQEVLLFLTDFTVPFDRYERRRSRAHSPGPTEPHALGFEGLLRLAGWRTASAHHARQLVPACRRSSRPLVELGAALACDH